MEIQRRVDDVVERRNVKSVAAIVTYEGQTWWAVAAGEPGVGSWATETPAIANRTFEAWVRENVVLHNVDMAGDGPADPGWVTLGAGTTPTTCSRRH